MNAMNETVLGKLVSQRFGFDPITAESVARDLIEDDFAKNGITTLGEAIAYLNEVGRMDRAAEQG